MEISKIVQNKNAQAQVKIEVVKDSNIILKYLNMGISIPILPIFHKYILQDFEAYNAKAILLKKEIACTDFGERTDDVIGITVVYDDGDSTLFFGFFGVYDHNPENISALLTELVEYGENNGYKQIRGPINIPASIFGWGFMVEGSRKNVFIGSPINPPIYQETFLERGFNMLFQEDRYAMAAMRMDPHTLPKLINLGINTGDTYNNLVKKGINKLQRSPEDLESYIRDTGDYPYIYINPGREGMKEIKDEYIHLFGSYMPPSAQITPKSSYAYDSLCDFIFDFGGAWMMWVVRYKPTNEMVACGYVIPDIFSKNKKGELDSISFQAWVVHPEHRRAYLAMIMYGFTSLNGINRSTPHYITGGSWPVGAENEANGAAARKMGGKKDRSHLILQLNL